VGERIQRWILRRAIERFLQGEAMDKILNIIPKGWGTKLVGWAGVCIAAVSLVGEATGHPIPGVQLGHDAAIQTIVGSFIGLFLRRKLNDLKPTEPTP